MIKCKYCQVEKPVSEISLWAGKPSRVCVECKKDHPVGAAGRALLADAGGGTPKKKAATRTGKHAAAELALSIPAGGFGVNAALTEEGYLQLTQANEGTAADNVCLTRHEVRQIFEKFGEWAVES